MDTTEDKQIYVAKIVYGLLIATRRSMHCPKSPAHSVRFHDTKHHRFLLRGARWTQQKTKQRMGEKIARNPRMRMHTHMCMCMCPPVRMHTHMRMQRRASWHAAHR